MPINFLDRDLNLKWNFPQNNVNTMMELIIEFF